MQTLTGILVLSVLIGGAVASFEREECGKQRPDLGEQSSIFIVGGTEADPGEYPWQAALYRYGRRICGATVVHPEWIITAAHCVDVINDPPIFQYMVGSNTLSNYDESQYYQWRNTTEVHVHPNYRLDSNDYDIALMRMSEPFEWKEDGYVYPACVPSADMVDKFPPGSDSVITGWGAEREGGAQSDDLNEVTIPITNTTYCNESYGGSISDYMICAGIEEGGIDSCQGDSGGPMVAWNEDDDRWYLIGVVSWGSGCARPGLPGVYARVTAFADWIEPIFEGGSPVGMPVGQCSDDEFQCEGGFCIDKGWRCDGFNSCYHDTDELYCESALKPFDVFLDKMIDTVNSDIFNETVPSSNDCGLTCLNSESACHAFDVFPINEMNETFCIFALNADYETVDLTLEESEELGITHFQRGAAAPPGTVFTSSLGTILTPAYAVGGLDGVEPGLLQYTMSINENDYNHMTFSFISINSQGNDSNYCADHATQNLVVMRGVESDDAVVKCLNEIKYDTNYEVSDEDAVLEFYSHDPQTWGFIVDYRASWYCDTVETVAPGYLVSPRYGIGEYPRNVRCHSLIQAPVGDTVRLEVEFFRIEFNGNSGLCPSNWDTVRIYDGPDETYELIGNTPYCGDTIPSEFVSTGNSLYVVFKSDSSAQETGYKFNFVFESDVEPTSSPEPSSIPTEETSNEPNVIAEQQKQIEDLEQELRGYKGGLAAVLILGGVLFGVLVATVCSLNGTRSIDKVGVIDGGEGEDLENGIVTTSNSHVNPDMLVNEAFSGLEEGLEEGEDSTILKPDSDQTGEASQAIDQPDSNE